MIRRRGGIGLACSLLAGLVFSRGPGPATGTVQDMVFTADADGGRSVLPTQGTRWTLESYRNSEHAGR